MPRYKRKSRLAEYQSKKKRRRTFGKGERINTDDVSTVAYSSDNNHEESLNDILDRISSIGDELLGSITTEYSQENIWNNCVNFSIDSDGNDIVDVALNSERNEIINNLRHHIGSDNIDVQEENNTSNEHMSNDNNSDHDEETCHCHVPPELEYAVNQIESKEILVPMLKHMKRGGVLDDFLIMLQQISRGDLKPDNLPLTLAVELAKWNQCESSTGMRFRPETLEFWNVYYRTCHGAGLNLASGSKHRGHVVGNIAEKGKYKPSLGSFNFAAPDPKTLLHHQKRVDRYIYSGIINGSFDLVDKMKQYVLEYDGKRISSGLGEYGIGDINLWGFEEPSLKSEKKKLDEEISLINDLLQVENNFDITLMGNLHSLLKNISKRIRRKRFSLVGHYKYVKEITKMCEGNDRLTKKYNKSVKDTKGLIHLLKNWISDALTINKKICWILSEINSSTQNLCIEKSLVFNQQSNVKRLHEPEKLKNKVNLDIHTHVVKQRSKKWFELRKEAAATGSSLYKAIGLDKLVNQKKHYDEFILGQDPKPFPKEVQEKMDYGTQNEIHAIGTLCSLFMPAFVPGCAKYIEDGANFIHGDNKQRLLEVSTDGFIKCCKNPILTECSNILNLLHENMVVEVKCKFPTEGQTPVHYDLPERYVTQILSEMRCKKVFTCLFVSYSKESTVFSKCKFDNNLWQEIWSLCKEFYDDDHCIKPSCLHPLLPSLKKKIKEYVKRNVDFLCELPSQCTVINDDSPPVRNPYITYPSTNNTAIDENQVCSDILDMCQTAIDATNKSHELCRRKAVEILTFIIGNSDRESDKNKVSHLPIAYGLKGYSLKTETMRKMIEMVRDTCKDEGVDILCEACDGQWAKIVFNTIDDEPLTRIQYQKKIWNATALMKKKEMIEFLLQTSNISQASLDEWSQEQHALMVDGVHSKGNVTVEVKHNYNNGTKKIYVISNGGEIGNEPLMCKIATTPENLNSSIWNRTSVTVQEKLTRNDILKYIPHNIIQDEINVDFDNEPETTNIQNCEDDSNSEFSSASGIGDERNILQKILDKLRALGKKKSWNHVSAKSLYRYHLCDAEAINSSFVVAELDVIHKVFKEFTGKNVFSKSQNKTEKVNRISGVIGNYTSIGVQRTGSNNCKLLKDIAYKTVCSGSVPKKVIACSVARIKLHLDKHRWLQSSTVPMNLHIDHLDREFYLYSFPEYSERREQLEPRTLDPTHILTNLRAQICKKGLDFFDKNSLVRVSEKNNTVLPRALVTEVLDQQNTEFAERVFSKEVEDILKSNGDLKESKFIKLVREWYEACDARTISPLERVNRWIRMHDFLTEGVNFFDFPPIGTHVKGIPVITYEGILQNISTRIILYSLSKTKTYNNRSIGTTGIENFYALLTSYDMTRTGCPKATQIHKTIPIMIDYNYHKNNANKIFNMDKRKGAPYPFHNMDKVMSDNEYAETMENYQFKGHNFDKFQRRGRKRKKRNITIGGINAVERGKRTVRSDFYKVDESKLNVLQKLGLPDDTDSESN